MPIAIDRTALRLAYRMDEEACVAERLLQAAPAAQVHPQARAIAARLVQGARDHKASGLDAFLQAYGLGTDEGIALMCLAEALLRVPDAATADALIHDKLAGIDWGEHVGESSSTFVNAATFSLMLTGQVLHQRRAEAAGLGASLKRAVGRLGEPVIRQATLQAMKILGGQFVFGRTIGEALERAAPERKHGLTHSFDMLGEAAMTFADADKYLASYHGALDAIAAEAGAGIVRSPGISVKLSALYPRYDFLHAAAARAALVPMLKMLALKARDADVHFTIDAEEAERLELSMDIIEDLVADRELFERGWQGFGLALQAYSKRAVPMAEWATALARKYHRRIMVRLVKGAYWDSEIKASQVGGFADFPVFTRKVATDVSYLACAAKMLAAPDAIYPAFATHNAYTIGAIKALAGTADFEFQRLHGMGEDVYGELARLEADAGEQRTPVRIYAPVGGHKELLAYLVRRLLENGANSSFVNRMADAEVPVDALVGDPVAELAALSPRRNPAIPLPADIFPGRVNSAGIDLADPLVRDLLVTELADLAGRLWEAGPTVTPRGLKGFTTSPAQAEPAEPQAAEGQPHSVTSPHNVSKTVGHVRDTTCAEVGEMIARAAAFQPGWDAAGGAVRAAKLEAVANLYDAHTAQFLSLCQREAGKSLVDAVLELREATDFLRYYATEARAHFTAEGMALPGPTGESNRLTLHGRGVIVAISPWNFPLAIFTGLVAGPLAAGNTVIAKPAEQTPLIAQLAIDLFHAAGISNGEVQLCPGDGKVGAILTSDPRIAGVAFTGSTETARAINRSLATRNGPLAALVAETGGQNAMIVDSSALPEQVTRDVVASAFQSAGQRCSALRVLYLQDDVADQMLDMIKGAFEALVIGSPEDLASDVGPVIDAEAKAKLDAHVAAMRKAGHKVWQRELPAACKSGHFVAPAIIEIGSIRELANENFGPVLHVARFRAEALEQVVDDINAAGFGLTLGLHSRIDAVRKLIEAKAKVGNFYVNRNQIGAVVGSQPFGGEGLSGTGPKAGGPHYLVRFATERVTCIDTTAAGGNASLMAGG